jgi:cobyrinic acid a,c-diamide synthase
VTLGLVAALRKRGLRVQTFKVGPDYLDPTYLSVASGRLCYNLDGWMTNKDYVRRLFADKAASADVSVIEGVMGLFDGSDPVSPEGSTAEIAAWLDCPVLLVVNAHGLSRSIAALVKGYCELDSHIRVAGVVANHCGSERQSAWLAESLDAVQLPPLVGTFTRGAFPQLVSRHLGLVTADSRNVPHSLLLEIAAVMERCGNLEKILMIARSAPDIEIEASNSGGPMNGKPIRLGVARDAAFHFYYPDNLEALETAGCELVYFSPLEDRCLPEGIDGLYIGGGYPEEHAEALAVNREMLDSVRRFAQSQRPVYAECGGLMYLAGGIESRDGKRLELVGLLPAWTRMLDRRKSLGYVEVTFTRDSLFAARGQRLRGHEFHYSELVGDPTSEADWNCVYLVKHRRSDQAIHEGFQSGRTLVSYVHAHFGSRPEAVERFVSVCSANRQRG